MPLQTAAQYQTTPNVLGGIQQGLVNRQMIQQEENKRRLLEQSQQELATRQRALGVPADVPQDESQAQAQQRLIANDPKAAADVLKTVGIVDQNQKEDAAAFANTVLNAPENMKVDLINERIRKLTAENRDPSHTMQLLEKSPEELNAAMKGLEATALTALQRTQVSARAAKAEAADTVQSSKLLPGGLVQLVMKSGEIRTVPADEANEQLIKAAERRGAELQGLRAGERGAAKSATAAAATAFKGLVSTRKNIANMNEGIKLLQGGAKTGAIEGHLPSFKAASIKLDNLRNRLGLDVIGGTTFGALSESELNFALKTALPDTLDEKILLEWMVDKRDAQLKVAANLEEAALFLGEPGNTVADFIKMKKEQRGNLPEGVTEEDIAVTMRDNQMTRQQVLDRLGAQ